MDNRADGVRAAYPLFQAEGGGAIPTSALQLRFVKTDAETVIVLNRLWHSRLPVIRRFNLAGGIFYAAEFDGLFYAAAVWTKPVARMLPQRIWLELRRLAIAPDAPRNTASRMLGWMVRDIKVRVPEVVQVVSYQDTEVHTGGIYRAAGWTPAVTVSEGGDWGRPSRGRAKAQSAAPKQRWDKVIRQEGEGSV
jgi:hypothetical protein